MSEVPEDIADQAKDRLTAIQQLVKYGLASDARHRGDEREWYRTILRTVADLRDECRSLERELSSRADADRVLGPSEISEAARITRAALYKRRPKS
ncbi:hypothetical protein ABZ695_35695 [Streptomyces sp. NPDC006976]|uniref:hypothetical protein n=1 Tax=Streptomyces sp. NPDC006976 TaxID=3154311 RepID=UPI003405C43C